MLRLQKQIFNRIVVWSSNGHFNLETPDKVVAGQVAKAALIDHRQWQFFLVGKVIRDKLREENGSWFGWE